MATVNLSAPQPYNVNIGDFWDARSGAAILKNDTTYRFYTGLFYVQVTGTGLTYSGDDPDPLGTGAYTSISLYTDAGFTNQIASYSSSTSIDFATYFSSGPTTALAGNDTISGQPGANIGMGGGNVALAGYGGDDTMSVGPGSGVGNNISGGEGNDTISGGDVGGGIVWNYLYGGDGDDTIYGGTIFLAGSVENYAYGEGGNDSLTGGNSALNHIYGGDGSDTLVGGGSSATNYLYGEGGDDNITAGNGATENFLYGGGGNDSITGGDGFTDTAVFSGAWINYTITGSGPFTITDTRDDSPDGTDTVSSVESFYFEAANVVASAEDLLNDAPTDIALSANTVAENAANNVVVGALTPSDADAGLGDTASFTLVDDAGGRFGISGTNLVVANGSLLDYETAPSHLVTIRVTDAHGLTFDKEFAVNLTDVAENAAPTVNANAGLTLNEGASATVTAAQLDFDDPDTPDTAITYTVTSIATNGTLFRSAVALGLNGNFTQADINNNLITYTHNGGETVSAAFGFSVSDGAGGLVTSQTFSFSITPVNDAPVMTAPVSVGSFNEDVPIVFSGGSQISVADVDSANLTVTLSSNAGGALSLNGTAGLTFITGDGTSDGGMSFSGSQSAINTALNGLRYVPGANFVGLGMITIQTSDGTAIDSDNINFAYTAVDDLPTVTLDNALANIAENTSTETRIKVADIVVTDVDGGTNVLGLSGTDAAFFEIDGTELFLKAGTIIDFEQDFSYAVSVSVDTPLLPPIALVSHALNVANISPETLTGTAAGETLTGGTDIDLIFGLDGNGGDGADTLTGGLGKDTQTGGLGADIFDFNLKTESKKGAANYDVIMDFDTVLDHIDLAGIDANSKRAGNQDFKFIGAKAFSEKAGQLHYLKKAGFVLVEGDINGDGRADFQIKVQGVTKLLADDFFGVVVPIPGRLDHQTAHHSETAQHEDFDALWGARGL